MNGQQLKNSILQLAIKGKLVKQLDEEGIAEELVGSTNINSSEVPFEIPTSWKWVKLRDIGDWGAGATPSRSNPAYYGGNIPWLKTGDLNDNQILETSEYITEKALNETSVKLKPAGSILIAMYGATIGKLGILNMESTTNQACCACITNSYVFNKFLFYYLMSQRNSLIKIGSGGAQPNISKTKLINYSFPLPPYKEQVRIVNKIEDLLPKISKYDLLYKEVTELNKNFPRDLKKSILQYAIKGKLVLQNNTDEVANVLLKRLKDNKDNLIKEKIAKKEKTLSPIRKKEIPFEIPNSWEWVKLGEIGEWGAGATPSRSIPSYYGGNIPWLKTGDLNDDHILSATEYITESALENTSVKLKPPGSILIAMYGATIGKLGFLNIEATTNQACCACIPYPQVSNKFLFYYLMSQKASLIKISSGGAQPNISKTKLVNYLFPLPPYKEQVRIVEKIENLLQFVEKFNSNIV